jgi:hypothetical protein
MKTIIVIGLLIAGLLAIYNNFIDNNNDKRRFN